MNSKNPLYIARQHMDDSFKPIIDLISRSERILLCTHRKPDGDAIGSIMGLRKALSLLGKEVTATCADSAPEPFHDLSKQVEEIGQEIPGTGDFVVTLDCDKTEVDRLKYQLEDNKIHIMITPKKGRFSAENISCEQKNDRFDLIITVDVADIPQLGKLYEDNADLFSSVPLVNIDHHISNTNFGKINIIDVKASSTAEMLYTLIKHLEERSQKSLLTPEVSTFLLSGITTDTGSFQNANTTPKALEIAASLMESGASQQNIIRTLFRTKKLPTLKLWGKILSHIEVDYPSRLVWSSISQQDLRATGTSLENCGEIIDELLVHAPEAEIVVLFKEDKNLISVSFRSKTPEINVAEIAKIFSGGGHVQASGAKVEGKSLAEVMREVLATVQTFQRKRLGITKEVTAPKKPVTQVLDGYIEPLKKVLPTLEQKGEDIHHKTKAAIVAEQKQADEDGVAPSKMVEQKKGKQDRRFSGVSVRYESPPMKVPEIPKNSPEPIVKTAPKKENPQNPFDDSSASVEAPVKPEPPKDPFYIGDDGNTDIERALGNL